MCGCCAQSSEAHFETIRYKLDKLDNQVHKLDDKYKTAAEDMLKELNDKEERAKAKLNDIELERHALEEKVKHWKGQRDVAEKEMLDRTKTPRVCNGPSECCMM